MKEYREKLEAAAAELHDEREARENRQRIRRANLPERYLRVHKPLPNTVPYQQKLKRWTERFLEQRRKQLPWPGLYLYGPPASGKTHLAVSIGDWASRNRVSTYYADFRDLFEIKKNKPVWDEAHPHIDLWEVVLTVKLLIVDDLGRGSDNAYGKLNMGTFEEILTYRHERDLTTIVTGNIPTGDVHNFGFARLPEIIQESCYDIEIKGANFRAIYHEHKEPLV